MGRYDVLYPGAAVDHTIGYLVAVLVAVAVVAGIAYFIRLRRR